MNELTEPQNDCFEDTFFELLSYYDYITDDIIEICCKEAHLRIGGEFGDESISYAKLLVKESKDIVYDKIKYMYKWINN